MKAVAGQMYRWGHHAWMETRAEVLAGVIVGLVVVNAFLGLYVISGKPLGNLPGTDITRLVPATGEQGFDAKTFCEDSLTSVSKVISPDASGVTYQMQRVKDGVSETVTIVIAQTHDVLFATHYWDTPTGQQSEPAFVDDDVKRCLERKT